MWGQNTLNISSLSPKRYWGPKRVNSSCYRYILLLLILILMFTQLTRNIPGTFDIWSISGRHHVRLLSTFLAGTTITSGEQCECPRWITSSEGAGVGRGYLMGSENQEFWRLRDTTLRERTSNDRSTREALTRSSLPNGKSSIHINSSAWHCYKQCLFYIQRYSLFLVTIYHIICVQAAAYIWHCCCRSYDWEFAPVYVSIGPSTWNHPINLIILNTSS